MVEIRNAALAYPLPGKGMVAALAGINARFPAGKITAILGPSGCGKTSLISMLAGLLQPDDGSVLIDGVATGGVTTVGQKTVLIFQDYGLLPWKTVRANAELPLVIAGISPAARRERVDALLHEFGLAPFTKRYPRQLSGGMKQRLAIVRALASEPDILLMDEPFSSLDALSREDAQDFLYTFTRTRMSTLRKTLTVILVTHSIEEAAYLADRIYVMTGRNPGTISACIDVPQSMDVPASPATDSLPLTGDTAPPSIPVPDTPARSDRASPQFQELCAKVRAVLAERDRRSADSREETAPARRRAPFQKAPGIIIALLGITALWALAAALVNRPFLPGPLETARAFVKIGRSGILARHTEASFSRIFWALLTASIPAAALGIAAGRNPRFAAFFSPILYIIHPLPKAAFLPVILLFLGLGEISKIFLIGFIVFSQILIAVRDAAGRIPPNLIDSVRSLGGGQGSQLRHVTVPAILPAFFTTLRVSLGTAAAVLFLAETFATDSGLGYLIVDAWTRIAYPEMYAAITALSLLALILFGTLDLLERLVCPWQ